MPELSKSRVSRWLEELGSVGNDENKAKAIYKKIREDKNATLQDREDFYRALAQQSFVWYLEALRGKPYTSDEMKVLVAQQAQKEAK
ncbi:MAG: hypothetical protein JXR83_17455 [Deltaproteobacteria bacterium]|nr:hypothetical protein [Deltaproteobacteria bacterium]